MKIPALAVLCLLALVPGCRREAAVPEELRLARESAAQAACISDELLRRAEGNLETLQAAADQDEAGSAQVAAAARRFAQAYWQHATIRHAVYAHADSAYNRARSAADSARYLARGGEIRLTLPEEGSLEGNAVRAYQRDFNERRNDPDHLCNWARS
jgi:hypothetical protein